jgi:hypothetical protein
VAGAQYMTVKGPLSTTRETEAAPNREVIDLIAASAQVRT